LQRGRIVAEKLWFLVFLVVSVGLVQILRIDKNANKGVISFDFARGEVGVTVTVAIVRVYRQKSRTTQAQIGAH
jgi:hypothetical protein